MAFQSSQNESIKVRLCPGAVLNVRNGNLRRRSERPMIRITMSFCARGLIRISSTEFDPFDEACDLFRTQLRDRPDRMAGLRRIP